ncbi:MAG: hypothetical protein WCA22_12375 [Candidatus Binatus sp.]
MDSKNNIYVANVFAASITVYSAGSNVNVAPIAAISGPNTHLAFPFGIALDSSDNIRRRLRPYYCLRSR